MKKIFKGFLLVLKSLFVKIDYTRLNLPVKLSYALIILAFTGLTRTFISIALGINFHGGVWFTFDPGVMFDMMMFPIFLALFPAMMVDYAFTKWRVKVAPLTTVGFFFYLQVVHIMIPFFEFLQRKFHIPCFIPLVPAELYLKFAISPLALTPLIFLVTNACTLGITMAWLISTAATIRFGIRGRAPVFRFLLLLMGTFYIIYVLTYPTYLLFFSHGNNFYYAMIYLLGSIGPVIYFKSRNIK
ncbi:MAG: hypothetical protein KAW12_13690 [Candidatus Aminicenantes bacterium]|nr:hypothetical protein [Candidatus Aminicenantes bacterium]